MRAPFQVLALPYKIVDGEIRYCVFHRTDYDQWQFIAGGGEGDEKPIEAVGREIFEEVGFKANKIIKLTSMCYIPAGIFPSKYVRQWRPDVYVIPEYAFGFECIGKIQLSSEHSEFVWLNHIDARQKLKWDSNRTALYELNCRLLGVRRSN